MNNIIIIITVPQCISYFVSFGCMCGAADENAAVLEVAIVSCY